MAVTSYSMCLCLNVSTMPHLKFEKPQHCTVLYSKTSNFKASKFCKILDKLTRRAKPIQIISKLDKWSSTVLRGVKITLKTVTKSDQTDSSHVDLQCNTYQGLTEKCARTSGFSSSSYPDTRTFVGRWSTQTCVKPRPLKILQNQ